MKKIILLMVCFYSFLAGFAQEKIETELPYIPQTTCDAMSACAEYEDEDTYSQCVMNKIKDCGESPDLEAYILILDKKKSVTTGVKNELWKQLLAAIFKNNKVSIVKKTKSISIVVSNKITKAVLTSMQLSPVNSKTYAFSSTKKFSPKEIERFMEKNKPTQANAIVLTKILLKSCSFSISIK